MKPKDYEPAGEVEAENEYAAWALLRDSETPLTVGDILELPQGQLRICKYVGFEEARWFVPETTVPETTIPGTAPPAESLQLRLCRNRQPRRRDTEGAFRGEFMLTRAADSATISTISA